MKNYAKWLFGLSAFLNLFCVALVQANSIEDLAPSEFEAQIAKTKGLLVINFSSLDAHCVPCVRANSKYQQTAQRYDVDGRFVQVLWQPWNKFPAEIQTFFQQNGINGVPARMVFQDGKLVNKLVGEPADLPPESPQKITGTMPVIDRRDIASYIQKTKGVLVVQLTSFETECKFCILSNPIFEALMQTTSGQNIHYARVAYRPWTTMVDDAFAKTFGYNGLPIFLTYQDGKLVRRNNGTADVAELQKALLDGLSLPH